MTETLVLNEINTVRYELRLLRDITQETIIQMLTNIANERNMSMKTMLPSYYTDAELIDVTNGR